LQLEVLEDRIAFNVGPLGNSSPGAVSGNKFADLNGDGIRDFGFEPGLQGWTIFADLDANGDFDEGEPFDVTDANGDYSITLDPGNYNIREVPQLGWTQTFPDDAHNVTIIPSGAEGGRNFANEPLRIIAVGADRNDPGRVFVHDAQTGEELYILTPFGESHRGGVRVAVGDVNGDLLPDIVATQGGASKPQVRVYHGVTGQLFAGKLGKFTPFDDKIKGAFPAVGDLGGIQVSGAKGGFGPAEIVLGADRGGKSLVRIFSGIDGTHINTFQAYENGFKGGVRVAVGHVDILEPNAARGLIGTPWIVTVPGAGRNMDVRIFDPFSGQQINAFKAFESSYHNGGFIAMADLDGDGSDEFIITATRSDEGGDASRLRIGTLDGFFFNETLYGNSYTDDIRVAAGDVNGDNVPDILFACGPTATERIGVIDGATLALLADILGFHDGAFIAADNRFLNFAPF
jgi:hypothetical protein